MAAPLKLLRVLVSHSGMVYMCRMVKAGYLCGKCGLASLGPRPVPNECCPQCGAVVEEAI